MAQSHKRTLRQVANDRAFAIGAGVLAVAGVVILAMAQVSEWWVGRDWEHSLVEQVGSILVAAMGLALIWDWRGRRALANEVYDRAGTAVTLRDAGLTGYSDNYLGEDWSSFFRDAQQIDVFLVYGRTWRASHRADLVAALARSTTDVRIVLGAVNGSESTMDVLSTRFSEPIANLKMHVEEAIRDYQDIAKGARGRLRVYSWPGDHMLSFYRFDSKAIVTLYSHTRERQEVPTFSCVGPGHLYQFVRNEIEKIIELSAMVFDSKKGAAQ